MCRLVLPYVWEGILHAWIGGVGSPPAGLGVKGLTIARGGEPARDALKGKEPQRRPQRRLDRRLEGVAKAVGGGYCRLHMPLKPALGVRGTVPGHRLGALEGGGRGGGYLPPFQCISGARS